MLLHCWLLAASSPMEYRELIGQREAVIMSLTVADSCLET